MRHQVENRSSSPSLAAVKAMFDRDFEASSERRASQPAAADLAAFGDDNCSHNSASTFEDLLRDIELAIGE